RQPQRWVRQHPQRDSRERDSEKRDSRKRRISPELLPAWSHLVRARPELVPARPELFSTHSVQDPAEQELAWGEPEPSPICCGKREEAEVHVRAPFGAVSGGTRKLGSTGTSGRRPHSG